MRSHQRVRVCTVAIALCVAGLLGQASPASAYPWAKPVAYGLANPGVILEGNTLVVHSTGGWKGHNVGTFWPGGRYSVTNKPLLKIKKANELPRWMNPNDTSVWAPSVVKRSDGRYVVYYAAVVKNSSYARCIGTGTGDQAAGPFKPNRRALACWAGSGAKPYDKLRSEGRGFSLIDATPAQMGSTLVLTYKTQYRPPGSRKWHTTTRMVRLDPADPAKTLPNPVHRDGRSIKITDSRDKYIEENPVLVRRGRTNTLFTSWGLYGTCRYSTRYRQNSSLWTGWLKKRRIRALSFTKKPNTCGTGNAHVTREAGSWLIFFNGHTDKATAGGPGGLYVGNVGWRKGKPKVISP